MPPKKKSGKKGKKSGKSTAPTISDLPTAAMGRDFYLLQIRDLENRMNRYQKKWVELAARSGKTDDDYYHTVKDRDEMVAFLKKSLEQRADELADLNDRYLGLQQAKESEREFIEAELQRMKNEQQETKETLRGENVQLTAKLASLDEFKYKKDELQARLQRMETELVEQQKDHREKIQVLHEKAIYDKDRLKKEMVMRVNQVAADFRKVSNKQMAETTKRTIRENVSINAQLTKMADKTSELMQENVDLAEKTKKQQEIIEKMEQNEKELAKRNSSNQKIANMLTEKSTNQEVILTDFEEKDHQYVELEEELSALRDELEINRDEIQGLAKGNENKQKEIEDIQKKLHFETGQEIETDRILSGVIEVLRTVLAIGDENSKSGAKVVAGSGSLLSDLLAVMSAQGEAAKHIEPPPSPYAILRDKSALSEMPGSRRGTKAALGSLPKPSLTGAEAGGELMPHYKLGDLGLVPRQADVIPTKLEATRGQEEVNHATVVRRALTRSVSVQTVSAPKALFFADQLLSQIPSEERHAAMTEFLKKNKSKKAAATEY